jgi:hypothetical protein
MYEPDEKNLEKINEVYPKFGNARGGTTMFDPWIDAMWAKYRTSPGMPPTDGWKPK